MNGMWIRAVLWMSVVLVVTGSGRGTFGQSSPSTEDAASPAQENVTFADNGSVTGETLAQYPVLPRQQSLSDLTLGNLFSAGWDDDYAVRRRETGTPNMPLLRVQTNGQASAFGAKTSTWSTILNTPAT